MSTFLKTIEILCLGIWLGMICLLSFVVAPGAFSLMPNQDLAGEIVRFTLARLHFIGLALGVIYLVAHFWRAGSADHLLRLVAFLVLAMILLTAFSQFYVGAHMAQLRRDMGSIASTSQSSPLRQEFEQYHKYSVWLESAVLLIGFAAMYLTVRSD
ncbi:MAG TPA: DUF4149 domain-containing protein [Candidatus Acidoferrales bacterium]|nr:DUF4149 domain-containing protein [Candidatus Acidoferrales bacterium]